MTKIEKIKKLREQTNLSLGECKKALEKASENLDDALIYLKGAQAKKAHKRDGNVASEGRIETYVHTGSQVATIVEVNCETDFASRSSEFVDFCESVAMHICAMQPMYVSRHDVSEEQEEAQRSLIKERLADFLSDKDESFIEEILKERINNWYREVVLLEQTCVTKQSNTIKEMIEELSAQLGEKIVISRFERWSVAGH